MNKADRDALRALYEAATPGEWSFYADLNPEDEPVIWSAEGLDIATVETGAAKDEDQIVANATLIPAAHNALPELLGAAGRAERYEAALREIVGNGDRKTLTLERAAALINKLRGIAREALAQPEEARS